MKVTALQLLRQAKSMLDCDRVVSARSNLSQALLILEKGILPGVPVEPQQPDIGTATRLIMERFRK